MPVFKILVNAILYLQLENNLLYGLVNVFLCFLLSSTVLALVCRLIHVCILNWLDIIVCKRHSKES